MFTLIYKFLVYGIEVKTCTPAPYDYDVAQNKNKFLD